MKKKVFIIIGVVIFSCVLALLPSLKAALDFGTSSLEVKLVENDTVKDIGDSILTSLANAKPGIKYNDNIKVKNTGSYSAYVRVTIAKEWQDASGDKITNLSTDLIDVNIPSSDWIIERNSTYSMGAGTTTAYYKYAIDTDDITSSVIDSIQITQGANKYIVDSQSQDGNGNTITTIKRKCDGYTAVISIRVDAVQSHNAEDAILGAWGRPVTITDGVLSLNSNAVDD